MPRRSAVGLAEILDHENLACAFGEAARGKRHRPPVQDFERRLERSLELLRERVLAGAAPEGRWACFEIRDPKPRRILAPCFPDRVLHHAMMRFMGPVLDRALVYDTYACRAGRGTLAAVRRAQHHARRFPWFVKADVRAYFASIDHAALLAILRRRFKDPGLLALCGRVLARWPDGPGRGLPIGALTSQHFANVYLDGLDRLLLERLGVRGMVRYMDDLVWWVDTRERAARTLDAARDYAWEHRGLELKGTAVLQRSERGLSFLGFRVFPGTLRLLPRRRRRYRRARQRWEGAWCRGHVDGPGLQAGYASALAITAWAHARAWRLRELERRPPVDA